MKRLVKSTLAIAAAALFSGCAAVRISRVEKTMADIEISSWQLFSFIPIASGDPMQPNEAGFKLFRDTVTLENNMKLLDYAIRKEGATGVRDIVSYSTDEYVFIFLLRRHSMHTSAELIVPDVKDYNKTEDREENEEK